MINVTVPILRVRDHTASGIEILESLREAGIPEHLHEGLTRYLLDGIRPGAFLQCVLTNDLAGAVLRYAGDLNDLKTLLLWLLNCTPSPCSGTPRAVDKWIDWKTADATRKEEDDGPPLP